MTHPDQSILSAWVDGEVPEPFADRVRSHVDFCPDCAAFRDRVVALSGALAASPEPDLEAAREAVWSRLAARASAPARHSVWRLRLEVPLPVAVAALLAFAVLGTLAVSTLRENGQLRLAAFAAQELVPASAQAAGFDSILSYLEAQDASLSITIHLPPNTGAAAAGKPVMMKAGDAPYPPYTERP